MIDKILPRGSRRRQLIKRIFFDYNVPSHIASNYIKLNASDLLFIKRSLEQNFFSKEPPGYLNTNEGKKDLVHHLTARLESDRKHTIPWLDNTIRLKDAKVLEVGCGTGASTIALAEQGAKVTAIDIDEMALIDAKKRCEIYGLKVDFHCINSTEVGQVFKKGTFDLIIFWACLEHMTHEERLIALKEAWEMLPSGGFICVTDTPNRLYYYDSHTSMLPFFNWLPDDLAIKYARFSPRQMFKEKFIGNNGGSNDMLDFHRWGRGLSFHEFELTMKPLDQLNIISCMSVFHRQQGVLPFLKSRLSSAYRFEIFFHKLFPGIHRGFFQPGLDLIIQKD